MKIEITDSTGKLIFRDHGDSVINRKKLCSILNLDNVTLSRIEKEIGFERAIKRLLEKKKIK
ncbi:MULTISPECIES: hypothetical protein [Pantoea]|uniref:hypothetical protein n=1 Tax=Pantoea TaxID=53335 RepID=UPI001231D705|nr:MULTISPECIES: hypothetical protein [unclassified Pantoea]KAA6103346.1 hypothetical protein F3I21_01080 [Pantoea sp. B_9]KAA6111746.1 hypothetical protein F3I18_15100 [Pantoea sp. B_10]